MKIIFTFLLASFSIVSLANQSETNTHLAKDVAPNLTNIGSSNASAPALFDLQFQHDASDSSGIGALAGVVYTGTEFWVSQWNATLVTRYSSNGSYIDSFELPGISGIRAMTFDGTYVYAANNTTTIYEIDPTTRTLTGNDITTSVGNVRHCTYDSSADAGNGGFYVGNFGTDIFLINRSGLLLNAISAATHTLTGMYGSAYDGLTPGGPYLWVFAQSIGTSQAVIAQLQLPNGTPTGVTHDVMTDVGINSTTGLAGGLNITTNLVLGENSLIGILQGQPADVLFGYELSAPQFVPIDLTIEEIMPVPGYSKIPLKHAGQIDFGGTVFNGGNQDATSATVDIDIQLNGASVYSNTYNFLNLNAFSSAVFNIGGFIPDEIGTYTVNATIDVDAPQTDGDLSNNTQSFEFEITDSTYARDDNQHNGSNGYGVSNTDWAYAITTYQLNAADTLTNIWISINNPTHGDTTYAVVCEMNPNGQPGNIIELGTEVIIDSAQNIYILEFNQSIALTAGTYGFGVYESTGNLIALSQSNNFYTPGTNFFQTAGGGWTGSSIETARFIRPNFKPYIEPDTMVNDTMIDDTTMDTTSIGSAQRWPEQIDIYPNPAAKMFNLVLEIGLSNETFAVYDQNGREMEFTSIKEENIIRIKPLNWPAGSYFIKMVTDQGDFSKTILWLD